MYKDKNTGKSKGEATVTYDDQNAARSAIDWFDGKEFKGKKIRVQIAQHKSNWQGNRSGGSRGGGGRGRGSGGFGSRGGGGDRDDHHRGGGDDRRDGGGRGGDWRYYFDFIYIIILHLHTYYIIFILKMKYFMKNLFYVNK